MKRKNPLMVYVALAYSISWLVFILLALNHHQIVFLFPDDAAHARLQDVGHSLGGLGPILAAIATLCICYKKESRKRFWRGYSLRRLDVKSLMFAFSPLLIFAFSLFLSRVITHEWIDVPAYFKNNKLNNPINLFAWLLPILFYGFGEEGGWRGYALPVLQSKYSAFKATVFLSIIWVCWHIPSFFYRFDLKGSAYIGFSLGIFAGAICLTFLFNYTKGSILAVSLWHFTFNTVSMVGKNEAVLSAIMSIMVMLLAGFVLIKYKFDNLSPVKKTGWQTDKIKPKIPTTISTSRKQIITKP